MNDIDIIIIGAGAAGLMAAHKLTHAEKKVIVLEARNRCGGRIHTLNDELFFKRAELGAEFIHGDLPVTMELLKEAGMSYHKAGGEMWSYKNGRFIKDGLFTNEWDLLMEKLAELKHDICIEDFLQKEFPDAKYAGLKNSVKKFVSGYDTADSQKASSLALRREWQSDDDGTQYRVDKGYGAMITYLENAVTQAGGQIYLNAVVKKIGWQPGAVNVTTPEGTTYRASKVLVALPAGVLQSGGSVIFEPSVEQQISALCNIGFGSVIKILLAFEQPFWEDELTKKLAGRSLKNMGFIISGEEIPTWWTQAPNHGGVLTGWLGGRPAAEKKHLSSDELLQESLHSLGNIFNRSTEDLKGSLLSFDIANWTTDPFTMGSYAYDTIESAAAREVLENPVDNTIFFAGEYLYSGPVMGTVEAALSSGVEAARKMLL